VLVLAGAGTGKTRVLTTRIAHILSNSAASLALPDPRRDLHQQGRARDEGAHRRRWSAGRRRHALARHLPLDRREACCAAMPSSRGLRSDFTILDTDDVIRLIKQLLQAEGLDDKRWPARQFAGMIDNWKNKGLLPADVPRATPAPSPMARAANSTKPTRTG
jgi:DNA helicase-2/ATP-dependent DNA helicase PcrA